MDADIKIYNFTAYFDTMILFDLKPINKYIFINNLIYSNIFFCDKCHLGNHAQ